MKIDKNHISRVPRFRKKSKIGPKKNSLHFSILAKKILLKSMGKLFPHPVGVFRTIPNPPKSRTMQKIDFWPYLVIFPIIPTMVGNPISLFVVPRQYFLQFRSA